MSEIAGIGVDLCAIPRMQALLSRGDPPARLFTEAERAYIRSRGAAAADSMAGLFAAKEALTKALGTGIRFPLTDIEIRHTPEGQPFYHLSGQAAALAAGGRLHLSISHDGETAAAFCVWERLHDSTKEPIETIPANQ